MGIVILKKYVFELSNKKVLLTFVLKIPEF